MPLLLLSRNKITSHHFMRCILIILSLIVLSAQQSILPFETNLPPATVGIPYIQVFSIQTPILNVNNLSIFNLTNLPTGFRIQDSQLFGIPLQPGNVTLQLALTSNGLLVNNTRRNYILTVNGISTASILPFTFANVPFSFNVSYVGGVPPFVWIFSGNPSWMTISESYIAGTPARIGSTNFSTTIIDSQNNSCSKSWTLITESNKLTLSPMRINGQINVPIKTSFTAGNGTAPYSFQFSNLPRGSTSNNNSLSITMEREGSFLIGVLVTDASGFKNYFSVIVAVSSANPNIIGFISSVSTSFSDERSNYAVIVYNVPPSDLVPGFSIQSNSNRPSFTFNDIMPKSRTLEQHKIGSLIRTADTTNNRNPCDPSVLSNEGSGTIVSVDHDESTIRLSSNIVLVFRNCTLQAFRGGSQKFEERNFVTYQGIPVSSRILLISITNTS